MKPTERKPNSAKTKVTNTKVVSKAQQRAQGSRLRAANAQNTTPASAPAGRAAAALQRLGVTQAALDAAPRISDTLRVGTGGLKKVIEACRYSEDPLVTTFLKKYDSIPICDRDCISFEAIGIAAGLNLSHLLGPMMLASGSEAANRSRMLMITGHPDMVKKRLEFAGLPAGYRDRDAIDMELNILPSPNKGGSIFINNKPIFGSGTNAMNEQRNLGKGKEDDDDDIPMDPDDIDMDKLFPAANVMQEKLQAIRNRRLTDGEQGTQAQDAKTGTGIWTDEGREQARRQRNQARGTPPDESDWPNKN